MNDIDKLIEEGEALLKSYNETKEAMLANPDIADILKKIDTGLGDGLKPLLQILYKERDRK